MLKYIAQFISFFQGSKYFEKNPEFIQIKRKALRTILLGGSVNVLSTKDGKQLVVVHMGKTAMKVQKTEDEFKAITYQKSANGYQKQKEALYMICDRLCAQISTKKTIVENSFSDDFDTIFSMETTEYGLFSTMGEEVSILPDADIKFKRAKLDSSIGQVHATHLKSVLTPEEIENMIALGDAVEITSNDQNLVPKLS